MKTAMRAKDKERLGTIRLILAEIKRIEVDERIDLDGPAIIVLLDKMLKQRRDSISQFEQAGRDDLANKEASEIEVIQSFLPAQLSDTEISQLIDDAIAQSGAQGMQDMGKVMGLLKPQLQGRANIGQVSGDIKKRLA
ncbi:GatB/YqeY domain-containing protein [Pseudomonadales bacterium]|nr:GatB/YqeY domain-containing protein [Pseudomonadales bacterium]MDC6464953.1 GatB/YqeY domain-containing protein [bacterium]MDA8965266.1 GatB/YqeY domain-containing protein [Pseudomonadales bacterium]MDB4090484.1 GatB/YqeY domain-containing protein [Pseudomonadales bacterium]MDB4430757.1 GatB/YqeY domain-containing protein [Pseudomonadales bacterium]